MELDWISTIMDWPTPNSVRDVEVRLRFTNFKQRFIRQNANLTLPLEVLLQTSETSSGKKLKGSARWESNREAEMAFWKLKMTFTEAPILQHHDPAKPIVLQTDESGFAIPGIVNQYDVSRVLRPVNCYTRKRAAAEQNYDTYDREVLAFVQTLKQWGIHLEGTSYRVSIWCDQKILE